MFSFRAAFKRDLVSSTSEGSPARLCWGHKMSKRSPGSQGLACGSRRPAAGQAHPAAPGPELSAGAGAERGARAGVRSQGPVAVGRPRSPWGR